MITLKPGDKAPQFASIDQDDKLVSLKDFLGQKVILYFYPEDDTPTCTIQSCNLRDHYSSLKNKGFVVVGVSPNDSESHKKFEKKFNLPFKLIVDTDHKIINKYGVWGEKNLYGRKYLGLHRTTFIIDEKGIIRKIYLKPTNKKHAEQILSFWNEYEK